MPPDPVPAGYCPDCDHLLDNDDVVRVIGRHMDGVDPTFRCPVCDGELAHPSRSPDGTDFYQSPAGTQGTPGSTTPDDPDRTRSRPTPYDDDTTVVAEQRPPLRLDGVEPGDRITVHFDRSGMAATQTRAGDVTAVRRSIAGTPSLVVFETDVGRRCSVDVGPDASLTEAGDRLGSVVEVVVTR